MFAGTENPHTQVMEEVGLADLVQCALESFAHDMPTIDVVYEVTSTQIILQRVRFRDALSSAGTA